METVFVWVACSQDDDYGFSLKRHLVQQEHKGQPGVTTLCGGTGATGLEFRKNSTKPKCTSCIAAKQKEAAQ